MPEDLENRLTRKSAPYTDKTCDLCGATGAAKPMAGANIDACMDCMNTMPNSLVACWREIAELRERNDEMSDVVDSVSSTLGIGSKARTKETILTNIDNMKRFTELLHSMERQFFMVPGAPDEEYPDDEPEPVCLLNSWGSTPDEYLRQLGHALREKQSVAVEDYAAALHCWLKEQPGNPPKEFVDGVYHAAEQAERHAKRLRTPDTDANRA